MYLVSFVSLFQLFPRVLAANYIAIYKKNLRHELGRDQLVTRTRVEINLRRELGRDRCQVGKRNRGAATLTSVRSQTNLGVWARGVVTPHNCVL